MKSWREFDWKDYLRVCAGVFMFFLGLIGLVLPVLQGVLFLLISAALLAPYSETVQRWKDAGERRWPGAHQRLRQLKQKLLGRDAE